MKSWFLGIVIVALLQVLSGCPMPAGSDFRAPVSKFTVTPPSGPAPLEVSFQNTSDNGGDPATVWSWDFGDGNQSSERNPAHTYTEGGTFPVTLTVTNRAGSDMALSAEPVSVTIPPRADFLMSSLDDNGRVIVTLTDVSEPGSSPITEWLWFYLVEDCPEINGVCVVEPLADGLYPLPIGDSRSVTVPLAVEGSQPEDFYLGLRVTSAEGTDISILEEPLRVYPRLGIIHTQYFMEGGNDLGGRSLTFIPTPRQGRTEYSRTTQPITEFMYDPTDHTQALFSAHGYFQLDLDPTSALLFYGESINTVFIGSNGAIGLGEPGDNTDLLEHFSRRQVSVVPGMTIASGRVSYAILDGEAIVITYENVQTRQEKAFVQVVFQMGQETNGRIILFYREMSPEARGAIGISDGPLDGASVDEVDNFITRFDSASALTTDVFVGFD